MNPAAKDPNESASVTPNNNDEDLLSLEGDKQPLVAQNRQQAQKGSSSQSLLSYWCGPTFRSTRPAYRKKSNSLGLATTSKNKANCEGQVEEAEDFSDSNLLFYDPKGYNNVLHKMHCSKKYQDSLAKILRARAKIEKIYSDSLRKWHVIAEREIQNLDIYAHERLFVDMILSRDAKIAGATSTLSNHITAISDTLNKKSDIFFGSAHFGTLENIKDMGSKFRVAQKHWMMHLKALEDARSHLANHCLNLNRLQRKYNQMIVCNPNLEAPENKKLNERIETAKSEQTRLQKRYSNLCNDIDSEKELYTNMMTEQYQTFLNIEKKRFQFNYAQLTNYFKKLEITSQEISMASLYSDMKDCLDEMDPAVDYRRFCEAKGAHGLLRFPVEEDVVARINKASDDLSQAATCASQNSTKGPRRKSTGLQIETTVGKSSEMKSEPQCPEIDFSVEKFRESMTERSKKAQEQTEKLQKESNINPDKSLNVNASMG